MSLQDTIMKALTRSFSGGALEVLGVCGVELAEPLPTELPSNTLRIDTAWRMCDGRVFHMEFQSTREATLHRFLEYDARLARQHLTQVRTLVLYHADVPSAPSELDIGTAVYRVENVFLSKLNGDAALDDVERHLQAGEWEPGDRLRLALALNMCVRDIPAAFQRVVRLVPSVPDDTERDLVVSAILALGDKSLNDQQRLFLRKELQKVSKIAEELYHDGQMEKAIEVARKLFLKGASVSEVMEITGLSEEEAEQVNKQIN